MYTRVTDFLDGSCLRGYYTVAPSELVRTFGEPSESDGYKVSGEFTFGYDTHANDSGGFTLYDWKSTSLYAGEPGLPTPADFWASDVPYEFHIGGTDNTRIDLVTDWLSHVLPRGHPNRGEKKWLS